jgi:hypothetical protein
VPHRLDARWSQGAWHHSTLIPTAFWQQVEQGSVQRVILLSFDSTQLQLLQTRHLVDAGAGKALEAMLFLRGGPAERNEK